MSAFDQAWDIVKISDPVDSRSFMEEHGHLPGMDKLSHTVGWEGHDDMDRLQEIILEQMLHPSNQFNLTTAKTPTLYRADRQSAEDADAEDFRHGRFFSPQLLTAEQYSGYQHPNNPSSVFEYEMPVPFDHDSVLRVPVSQTGLAIASYPFKEDDSEVARLADANDMSLEDAVRAINSWRDTYLGNVARTSQGHRLKNEAIRNAGYNYIIYPEVASQVFRPPTAGSAFGAIDWGAAFEGSKMPMGSEAIDEWWEPTRNVIMQEMGIPNRGDNAMGKHYGFPQWAAYHIGDEDSAPEYRRRLGIPELTNKYRRVDYPNFSNTARIAQLALSGGME